MKRGFDRRVKEWQKMQVSKLLTSWDAIQRNTILEVLTHTRYEAHRVQTPRSQRLDSKHRTGPVHLLGPQLSSQPAHRLDLALQHIGIGRRRSRADISK